MLRATLDTGCWNIKPNEALDKIHASAKDKKIELSSADIVTEEILENAEYLEDLPEQSQKPAAKRIAMVGKWPKSSSGLVLGHSRLGTLGKAIFVSLKLQEQIKKILTRDGERVVSLGDIKSLLAHYYSKRDVFITKNTKDFSDEGRKEKLKAEFNIKVMTPEEFCSEYLADNE